MRARALIPAWGKAAFGVAAIAAFVALIVVAPWRQPLFEAACGELSTNIDLVVRGGAPLRVSDTITMERQNASRGGELVFERGDFRGALSLADLRSCLGPGWVETTASSRQDVWAFVRHNGPTVMYVQTRNPQDANFLLRKITIERTAP